jgi:hypothetical protein
LELNVHFVLDKFRNKRVKLKFVYFSIIKKDKDMKFEIKSNYDQQLKDLIKAFNSGLITFDEMCELNMNVIDKANIDRLKE